MTYHSLLQFAGTEADWIRRAGVPARSPPRCASTPCPPAGRPQGRPGRRQRRAQRPRRRRAGRPEGPRRPHHLL